MRKIRDHYQLACESHAYAYDNLYFEHPAVSSHLLSRLIDYKIAQDGDISRFVYFGSLDERGLFHKMFSDVEKNGVESPFYGSVLSTSGETIGRHGDGNEWHPYKNKAFWAGAIDASRCFYLLTNIRFYLGKAQGGPRPDLGTAREILWLLDNGYGALPDPLSPKYTIFFLVLMSVLAVFFLF